ncbi:MAG TPA: amidohydrolase, partial [Firmicutes bacterium]|nr:amidohydrolase [Bacillota bacterium]
GIVAKIEGKNQGRVIGLRGDIDALPMQEANQTSYCSLVPGKMHACGHDVHTTILLGAGMVLQELVSEFDGYVKLFFQPAEETVGGAETMIKAGCLENPNVEHVLGLHCRPTLEVGDVGFHYGKCHAASDTLMIHVKGKSSHGAYPQDGIDAIMMAAHVIVGLQSIISRNVSPFESTVLSLGIISGGDAGNVVCDHVTIQGTLRTLDQDVRTFMKKRIVEVVEHTTRAHGGFGYVEIEEGYLPLINNRDIVEIVKEVSTDLLGEEHIHILEHPSLGVEDFSYFTEALPSCFYNLGVANTKLGINSQLHSTTFDIDEEAIKVGVCVQVLSTLKLLGMNDHN